MLRHKTATILILILLVIGGIRLTFFTVDETEYVVVTQFGDPVRVLKTPGLYIKWPDPIQTVNRFNNWLVVYDPPPAELLTLDKKNILVDSFMLWKIDDPQKFLETVKDQLGAEARLSDILSSHIGSTLGKYPLNALVSTQPTEMKFEEIQREVTEKSAVRAKEDYGIEVVDVRLKRLNFPEQNKRSVFERMRAERLRIAKKFRSEGEEEALKIEAETAREERSILSAAYRDAQKIKGDADAEAIRIYAEAFGKNPQFYKFIRLLESYQKFLNEKTTLVLPSDADLLQLLSTGQNGKITTPKTLLQSLEEKPMDTQKEPKTTDSFSQSPHERGEQLGKGGQESKVTQP